MSVQALIDLANRLDAEDLPSSFASSPQDVEAIVASLTLHPPTFGGVNPRARLVSMGFTPELLSDPSLRAMARVALEVPMDADLFVEVARRLSASEHPSPCREGWGVFVARAAWVASCYSHWAGYYGSRLVENFCRERGAGTAGELIAALADEGTDVDAELEAKARRLLSLRPGNKTRGMVSVMASASTLMDELGKAGSPLETAPRTGFFALDRAMGGMRPGEVLVVGARPGCGKTTFGLQVALHNALRGLRVVFVSAEMTSSELTARLLCSMSGVALLSLRNKALSTDDRDALRRAELELSRKPLHFLEAWGSSVEDIEAHVETLSGSGDSRADLIVVDYLGLLSAPGTGGSSIYERVSHVSRAIKVLSGRQEVPVIALSQLSRQVDEATRPRLSDLRDSGSVEQDADRVLFLWQDPQGPQSTMSLALAKNRHGATGDFRIGWNREAFRLEDLSSVVEEIVLA